MSKPQLTQLLVKGDKPYQSENQIWFKRYNDVVDVFNQTQGNKNKLQKLDCTYRPYIIVSSLLNNYLLNIATVIFFTFLPFINIFIEIFFISYTLFLRLETKKHQQNLKRVQDPFENFYYYPEMCMQLEKHFTTLNLKIQDIQNFTFNQSHERLRINLLRSQFDETNREFSQDKKKTHVKLQIYDQYFYDSFFLVRKQYFKAISWSFLGMALIALSVLFYSAIYEDLTN